MSHVETLDEERRGWWERLFSSLLPRPEEAMSYQLPPDSLFADSWNQAAGSVADVPEQIKAQIREEAVLSLVNRLEASLRLLLYATTPGKEPPTAERCHQILNVWRYELEHRIHLTPDTYCGAVQRYEPEMEAGYSIIGRCQPGDLLRIRVPCWRMYEKVVIRGEAELIESVDQLDIPLNGNGNGNGYGRGKDLERESIRASAFQPATATATAADTAAVAATAPRVEAPVPPAAVPVEAVAVPAADPAVEAAAPAAAVAAVATAAVVEPVAAAAPAEVTVASEPLSPAAPAVEAAPASESATAAAAEPALEMSPLEQEVFQALSALQAKPEDPTP